MNPDSYQHNSQCKLRPNERHLKDLYRMHIATTFALSRFVFAAPPSLPPKNFLGGRKSRLDKFNCKFPIKYRDSFVKGYT